MWCIPVIVIWDDTILLFKQTNYCQAKNAVRLDKGHLQEAIWGGSNQRGLLCQPSGRGLKSNSWYRGVFRLLLTDVKAMESGDWTLVYYNLMSALTLIKALCLVLYFQVTLAGYKKFLAVEVISGFLTWHQSFHLTFVKLPFPGCPWAPESSWRGAKSHQRSRSKDWGDTWWIFSRVFFCTFREGTSEQNHPGYHEFMFHQVSVDSKHNTLSGLAFPLQPEATDAIREYSQGTKDYVQLAIGEESCCNCAKKATFLENFYLQIWPKRPSRLLRVVLALSTNSLERSPMMLGGKPMSWCQIKLQPYLQVSPLSIQAHTWRGLLGK